MSKSRNILLFGDFNSRTGLKCDFVRCDKFISESNGNEDLYNENVYMLNYFDKYDILLQRNSADLSINFYGQQLLEFCKSNNIFILNGRLGASKSLPKNTCKDRSTVDYFISTVNNFPFIQSLEVSDFESILSDAHCAVSLSISTQHLRIGPRPTYEFNSKPKLWDEKKIQSFVENIDENEMQKIQDQLTNITQLNANQDNINEVISQIENLFLQNAKVTFGTKQQRKPDENTHKEWFDSECKRARNVYHYTRKLYNKHKNTYYKNLLKTVSKDYKCKISKSRAKFKNQRVDRLRNLKTSNPKEFWKIINSVDKRNTPLPPIGELHDFFKNLNSHDNDQEPFSTEYHESLNEINEEINQQISNEEILKATKRLRNNKSPGPDNVLNEHIKSTINLFLPIYSSLFNLILDTGIVPESWSVGDILPIYKNKGSVNLPENYRPITLLSCLGKLFTSILNNRLNKFTEKYEIICHNQAGFRRGLSTSDNLFVLQSLFEMSKSTKNKLFCAFIDFKQAFDNVWRDGLWYKLQKYNINGKCLNLIKNMYNNIKSRIVTPDGNSAFFPCCKGVRQGENLSPILFSLYLNDLENYLMSNGANGIVCEANSENIYTYIKLLVILFADDTVFFSNNQVDLQHMLNLFEQYCDQWKLTVNISKTKILIFTSGRSAQNLHFTYKGKEIEIVTEYKYLGIYLAKSGSYLSCKKHIAEQANHAMFSLLRKIRVLNLPIEMQIDLFNKLIKPILLYGCEIWGFGNLDIIERVQLKFLKLILNLKKSTPSFMVYGETGTYPLKIDIQARIISFWTNLLEFNSNRLSSMIYKVLHIQFDQGKCKSKWIENIKNLVTHNGYANVWLSQSCPNKDWFRISFKQKVKDQYLQHWFSLINSSSSGITYRIFKKQYGNNKYFSILKNSQCRILTAFRTRNHRLPIEVGRWGNIPISERICHLCKSEIGDEFHYIFKCTSFNDERKSYTKAYFRNHPNTYKMNELMNSTNTLVLKQLTCFTEKIMKTLKAST